MPEPVPVDDRLAIHELVNLHGHLMDGGEFGRLGEFMTADCTDDVTALGGGMLRGAAELEAAGRALGDRNPLAHHVTPAGWRLAARTVLPRRRPLTR